MTALEEYNAYAARRAVLEADPRGDVWICQEKRYIHPFRIFGNVWYVGDDWVCVHLIDTGDGLLLIDSGNCGATAMLVNAIWEAGFKPSDVKWIIHSHGHVDHIGGANFFRRMFGTKLYLGAPDAEMYRRQPGLSGIQDAHDDQSAIFTPDYEIKEGDVLTFGNTTMEFTLVPGHTEGCVAIFFDAQQNGEVRRCGYYGGFGFNTLRRSYLDQFGLDTDQTRRSYLDSLAKVRDRKVEIFLGNHCINNDTLGRRKRQIENPNGPNPFIDPLAWSAYLDDRRDALLAFMADPANN